MGEPCGTPFLRSYDAERMITQYKELTSGGRSFYTALGHAANNYTDPNNEFETLNKNALYWVANPSVSSVQGQHSENNVITIYPNPANKVFFVKGKISSTVDYHIYNATGQEFQSGSFSGEKIDLVDLKDGLYFLVINDNGKTIQRTFQVVKDN